MPKFRSSLLLVMLTYAGFFSLGLPDGLLGVTWPAMRATFGLPLSALGSLLALFTAGYLLSSIFSGWLLARVNVGSLLALRSVFNLVYGITAVDSPSFQVVFCDRSEGLTESLEQSAIVSRLGLPQVRFDL